MPDGVAVTRIAIEVLRYDPAGPDGPRTQTWTIPYTHETSVLEALQSGVTGRGFIGARFSLLALGLTGVAGCLAGAKLFRWDAQQRFFARTGKAEEDGYQAQHCHG